MASRISSQTRPQTVRQGNVRQSDNTSVPGAVEGAGSNEDQGGQSHDRDTDQMGGVPSFTAADFRPEFRISVRPPPGGTTTPVPALAEDWRQATLDARAKELGMQEIAPQLRANRQQTEAQLGRELEPWEGRQVDAPLIKQLLPPVRAKHYQAITKDTASQDQAIADSHAAHGSRLQKARDPFTPLALGDPQARAKDRVLWENNFLMVIVDSFAPSPKALVIPKKQAMFPKDLAPGDMEALAKTAAKVSDAFGKVAGSGPADIWVNPPQRLTIKQLHTHVLPKLPRWENPGPGEPGGRDPKSDVPAHVVAEQNRFYAALEAELQRVL